MSAQLSITKLLSKTRASAAAMRAALRSRPSVAFAQRALAVAATKPAMTVHTAPHFRRHTVTKNTDDDYMLSHPVYSEEEVAKVEATHLAPQTLSDRAALLALRLVRTVFDLATGYGPNMRERDFLTRIIFLETVAGVPGMVSAMLRHMRSLARMQRDFGWVHTLLEEAENERMHLLTFLELRQPGPIMRASVLLAQGVMVNGYTLAYLLAPRTCHRFVGYLEEEAVKTYTRILAELDAGKLPEWSALPAPEIAKKYWRLRDDAMFRDVILAVRADEAIHRDVNHVFAALPEGQPNPFK